MLSGIREGGLKVWNCREAFVDPTVRWVLLPWLLDHHRHARQANEATLLVCKRPR